MKRVLLAALLLPACSAGVARTPPAAHPAPGLTVPDPRGLGSVGPTPWDEASYVDSRTVDVHFTAGLPECGRLAAVDVAETREAVTITLRNGTPRQAEDTVCPAIGINATTRVRLPHALDGRRLVDGYAGDVRVLR